MESATSQTTSIPNLILIAAATATYVAAEARGARRNAPYKYQAAPACVTIVHRDSIPALDSRASGRRAWSWRQRHDQGVRAKRCNYANSRHSLISPVEVEVGLPRRGDEGRTRNEIHHLELASGTARGCAKADECITTGGV